MKRPLVALLMTVSIILYPSELAQADLFGGDVAVLVNILANALQQLSQLRAIVGTGNDTLGVLREVNRGINDSLQLYKTINPNADPGMFREWSNAPAAFHGVTDLYGTVVPSKDSRIQTSTDQSVAEAVALNNSIYTYTRDVDDIGEQIKSYSHTVSPGGAQKLTAESMGVMLHVMNTSLRAQATSLKIQAEVLALQNHKDKEASRETTEASESLKAAVQGESPKFEMPRF
ncbi:hypothetical protein WDW37_20780 [Bdellovibrionota bacterium FG-1]